MILPKLFASGRIRSNRRRTFIPETLEDRNLLSAAVVGVASAQVRPHVHSVRLHGAIDGGASLGTATFDSSGNTFVPVSYAGTGTSSKLGLLAISGTHTTQVLSSTGYSTSTVADGKAKITTANGDSFSFTYTGQGTLLPGQTNLFTDTFSYTITGGTGRYAGAKGSGVIHSTDLRGGTSTEVPFVFVIDGIVATVR